MNYYNVNLKWISMDKWIKVQEHPVLECGVRWASNSSTIMVYDKEDSYTFMRTEGGTLYDNK